MVPTALSLFHESLLLQHGNRSEVFLQQACRYVAKGTVVAVSNHHVAQEYFDQFGSCYQANTANHAEQGQATLGIISVSGSQAWRERGLLIWAARFGLGLMGLIRETSFLQGGQAHCCDRPKRVSLLNHPRLPASDAHLHEQRWRLTEKLLTCSPEWRQAPRPCR